MLVLTRKSGEAIRLGDDVVITVTHISRDRVKLGIEAPREVPILRGELAQTSPEPRLKHPCAGSVAAGSTGSEQQASRGAVPPSEAAVA